MVSPHRNAWAIISRNKAMAISAQRVSIPRADISISRDKASAFSWMNWARLVMGKRLHDGSYLPQQRCDGSKGHA
jgi:hypothetical protein